MPVRKSLPQIFCAFGVLVLPLLVGCGGEAENKVVTEADELSQWVADNPAPPEIEIEE